MRRYSSTAHADCNAVVLQYSNCCLQRSSSAYRPAKRNGGCIKPERRGVHSGNAAPMAKPNGRSETTGTLNNGSPKMVEAADGDGQNDLELR